jgi:hypothetical protein
LARPLDGCIGRFCRRLGRLLIFIERSNIAARHLLVELIVRQVNEDRKLAIQEIFHSDTNG